MPGLDKPCWNRPFSHVYAEEAALGYPLVERILESLPEAKLIRITHYKDIFNRPGQDFDAQKLSPSLILAVRRDRFLFPGSELCENYGHTRFFYATQMMNCLYNCEYCYLRGLYGCGHVVAFVNTEDYFNAARAAEPAYVSISYDTDLLALERLFHFVERWIGFAAAHPSLTLEIRTKSAAFDVIAHLKPVPNVILSWTLSPDSIIQAYEKGTPPLVKRVEAMHAAVCAGWNVRLCVDPVLLISGWEEEYRRLSETVRMHLDMSKLQGIDAGGFRVSKTHFKRMRRSNPGSALWGIKLTDRDGAVRYPEADEENIKTYIKGLFA